MTLKHRPKAMLLIGPTGSGKTPFGLMLEKQGLDGMRCKHFDFGNELRCVASTQEPAYPFTREEHGFVVDVLEKGLLLENEHFYLAEKIFYNFCERIQFQIHDMLILNGMPRHEGQAKDVARIVDIRAVVELMCEPHVIHKRIQQNTGGDRHGRDDDHLHLIQKKVAIYHKRTVALVDHYTRHKCHLYRIEVGEFTTADEACEVFVTSYRDNRCF